MLMDWVQALLLGVLQGLTEFLPISSTGLLGLQRVDPMQADSLSSYLKSIAVDDADLARDVVGVDGQSEEHQRDGNPEHAAAIYPSRLKMVS